MTRTINLSNTQFRYQLVFFVHIYGYIWLAEGCLWHLLPGQNLQQHLLPRQNLPSASSAQEKHARRYVLPGCMISLIQRAHLIFLGLIEYTGDYTVTSRGISLTSKFQVTFAKKK